MANTAVARQLRQLLLGMLLARAANAEEGPVVAVQVDFTRAHYPPLVKKWGGVDHWDVPGANTTAAMAADAARGTPMVLGVMQLGTTMTSTPSVILRRDPTSGSVVPVLQPSRLALRAARGGSRGVLPLLQLDGCPTPAFAINSSSIPSPSARYYPMCEYRQLEELAAAFASYARALRGHDGLSSAWSFWPEPGHTLSDKHNTSIYVNFEACEPAQVSSGQCRRSGFLIDRRGMCGVAATQTSTSTRRWRRPCTQLCPTTWSRAGRCALIMPQAARPHACTRVALSPPPSLQQPLPLPPPCPRRPSTLPVVLSTGTERERETEVVNPGAAFS